jgi:hypothetical protein
MSVLRRKGKIIILVRAVVAASVIMLAVLQLKVSAYSNSLLSRFKTDELQSTAQEEHYQQKWNSTGTHLQSLRVATPLADADVGSGIENNNMGTKEKDKYNAGEGDDKDKQEVDVGDQQNKEIILVIKSKE